jgi:hypothetical protein
MSAGQAAQGWGDTVQFCVFVLAILGAYIAYRMTGGDRQ